MSDNIFRGIGRYNIMMHPMWDSITYPEKYSIPKILNSYTSLIHIRFYYSLIDIDRFPIDAYTAFDFHKNIIDNVS